MERARHHHYLPQFYLAGFTHDGTRDGSLFVFDQLRLKGWASTPERAGAETDLYTVTLTDGAQSDLIEKALSKFEGAVAPAVQQVVDTGALPTGESMDRVLDFIALLSARTPSASEGFTAMMNQFGKQALRRKFADRDAYVRALARRNGGRLPTDGEVDALKKFIEGGRFSLRPDQGAWVRFMTQATLQTAKSLSERRWSMVTAVGAEFVCSDHPAVLCFNGASPYPDGFRPGFQTSGTWLVVPLSKRCAMIGTLDGPSLRGELPVEGVAWINRKVIERSHRFLIHATDEIVWLDQGVLATKQDLIEARRWTAPPPEAGVPPRSRA